MRESIRNGAIIVVGFGLMFVTSALGAISIADRIQQSASMSEPAITAMIVNTPESRRAD
jgi:hypothetical protein